MRWLNEEEVVSASTDSTLRLWNARTLDATRTFAGHANEKNFVGLGTDSEFIACGSETNEVRARVAQNAAWVPPGHAPWVGAPVLVTACSGFSANNDSAFQLHCAWVACRVRVLVLMTTCSGFSLLTVIVPSSFTDSKGRDEPFDSEARRLWLAGVCVLQSAGEADCEAALLCTRWQCLGRRSVHQRSVLEASGSDTPGCQQPGLHQGHAPHILVQSAGYVFPLKMGSYVPAASLSQ